jgi:TetR/AcrR family transcriptional regulator
MSTNPTVPAGVRSIMDAATELFADEGFEAVSIAAIAARAGISKANVFHHFASKQALYLAVMRETTAKHAEFAEALLTEECSSAEKLRRLLAYDLDSICKEKQKFRLVFREIFEAQPHVACELAHSFVDRTLRAVQALVEQGQASGEFRSELDPAVVSVMLGAASMFYFQTREVLRHLPQFGHADLPQGYAICVGDLLLSGLCAPPSAAKRRTPARSGTSRRSRSGSR